jgi:transposase
MVFWKKKKNKEVSRPVAPQVVSVCGHRKSFSLPVRLVAMKGKMAGMASQEVSQLIGASAASIDKWFRTYREKGVEGLVRKSAHHSTRKLCDKLEKRIEEYRLEYPRKVSILLHEMTHGNQTRVPFVK